MRTITKEFNIYKYNELSQVAKEKVKEFYLKAQEPCIFEELCNEELHDMFHTDLNVQFSLSYCQGDGFNIYGKIGVDDILNALITIPTLPKYQFLTVENIKKLSKFGEICGRIELPENRFYCYSVSDRIDFCNDWIEDLTDYCIALDRKDRDLIFKFQQIVRKLFSELCNEYEKRGYEFFYETTEENIADWCEYNEFEFYEDGSIY